MKSRNNDLARPKAYWETVQERIDTTQCAEVVRSYINKEHNDKDRAELAFKVVSKFIPNFQAVSITDNRNHLAPNRADIEARMLALGIAPDNAWSQIMDDAIDVTPEKIEVDQDDSDPPLPPNERV